jgi:glycosyltransferase involved in cell wall biosynthesis
VKILLLSAYDANSHQYWRKGIVENFPEYDWTVLTLPPRYFNWRIRGNSLSWAFEQREVLEQSYDLLIATSMTDLSALKGFVPALSKVPTLVYFHENQFAYPQSEQQFSSVEPQVLNLYTALAADKIAFNSVYNRDTFLSGVKALLKKLPDHVPEDLLEQLNNKSEVLAVPLRLNKTIERSIDTRQPIKLLWNHRWEYDKGPQCFFKAIKLLLGRGVNIQMYVLGERFRQSPTIFDEMKTWLDTNCPDVLKAWGYIESKEDYEAILEKADIVVSTAIHDFQGLSIMEAVAHGCIPVVPDRLAYPQWFEPLYRYPSSEGDSGSLALADKIESFCNKPPANVDLSKLYWSEQKNRYATLFEETRL